MGDIGTIVKNVLFFLARVGPPYVLFTVELTGPSTEQSCLAVVYEKGVQENRKVERQK